MAGVNEEFVVSFEVDIQDAFSALSKLGERFERLADPLERALESANRSFDKTTDKIESGGEKAERSLKEVENQAEKTGQNGARDVGTLGDKLSGIAGIATRLAGIVTTLAGSFAVAAGINYNANMESSLMAWETLLGNQKEAEDTMERLIQLGAKTPFEFEGLDKAAKMLQMAKFEGDNLEKALVNIGDAVSAVGGGQAELEGVATALFQMSAKGKISAEEMMQLSERSIPAWEILADKMGVTTEELMDMTSKGKVLSKDVLPLLIEGMGEKFAGSMDKQSKTFKGMISTMKDTSNMVLGKLFEPLFNNIKKVMPKVQKFMDAFLKGLEEGGIRKAIEEAFPKEVSETIFNIADSIKKFFNFIQDNWSIIQPILAGIVAGFTAFHVITGVISMVTATVSAFSAALAFATSPIGAIALAIGALVAAGIYLYKNWDEVKAKVTEIWNSIDSYLTSVLENISSFFKDTWNGIKDFFVGLWNEVSSAFSNAWNMITANAQAIWTSLVAFFTVIWDGIKLVFTNVLTFLDATVGNAFRNMWTFISSIFQTVWAYVQLVWENIKVIFATVLGVIVGLVTGDFDFIKEVIFGAFEKIKTNILNAWNKVKSIWTEAFGKIKTNTLEAFNTVISTFTNAFTNIKNAVVGGWNFIKDKFTGSIETVKNAVGNFKENVKSKFEDMKESMKSKISDAMENIKSKFTDGMGRAKSIIEEKMNGAKDFLKGLPGQMKSMAWDIAMGLVNGLKEKINRVREIAGEMADTIKSKIRGALGIASPSKVMIQYGAWTTEGLVKGIESKKNALAKSVEKMAQATIIPFEQASKKTKTLLNGLTASGDVSIGLDTSKMNASLKKANLNATNTFSQKQDIRIVVENHLHGDIKEAFAEKITTSEVKKALRKMGGVF